MSRRRLRGSSGYGESWSVAMRRELDGPPPEPPELDPPERPPRPEIRRKCLACGQVFEPSALERVCLACDPTVPP